MWGENSHWPGILNEDLKLNSVALTPLHSPNGNEVPARLTPRRCEEDQHWWRLVSACAHAWVEGRGSIQYFVWDMLRGEGNWQGQRHKEKVFVLQAWAPASRACLIWSERHLVVRNYMSPVYLIFDSYCTMLEGSSSLQSGQVFQLFQRSLSLSIQWSRKTSSLHACCITGKKKRLWRQQNTQMWKTL